MRKWTEGDPKAVTKSVAGAINSVDPELPLAGVKTIDEIVSESLAIEACLVPALRASRVEPMTALREE